MVNCMTPCHTLCVLEVINMPSQTFFNLDYSKQKKLLDAAKQEFCKVPYTEVSINKIIQTAEISRGSFYTYFVDKNDLFAYILELNKKVLSKMTREVIVSCHGDMRESFLQLFDLFIKKIEEYVEQVLFYVRSEHSSKDYLIHECDLNIMIKNVILRNKDDFLTLNISVETKNLNKKVLTDSKWFEYIINQIVSNAKKYKKEEDSMIHFEAEETENEIKISIKDNGIGIKESDLPKVFEKSFTGENGHNTKESTGMGLFLVKKMCEQLGHQVEIESIENEYTKVIITISKNSFYNVLK